MSLQLEFTPHSWYYEFAIKKNDNYNDPCEFTYGVDRKNCIVHGESVNPFYTYCEGYAPKWSAYTDNGNTYKIIEFYAETLEELKSKIRKYWLRDGGKHVPAFYSKKLLKSEEAK